MSPLNLTTAQKLRLSSSRHGTLRVYGVLDAVLDNLRDLSDRIMVDAGRLVVETNRGRVGVITAVSSTTTSVRVKFLDTKTQRWVRGDQLKPQAQKPARHLDDTHLAHFAGVTHVGPYEFDLRTRS